MFVLSLGGQGARSDTVRGDQRRGGEATLRQGSSHFFDFVVTSLKNKNIDKGR